MITWGRLVQLVAENRATELAPFVWLITKLQVFTLVSFPNVLVRRPPLMLEQARQWQFKSSQMNLPKSFALLNVQATELPLRSQLRRFRQIPYTPRSY